MGLGRVVHLICTTVHEPKQCKIVAQAHTTLQLFKGWFSCSHVVNLLHQTAGETFADKSLLMLTLFVEAAEE
jgi:hypothetical protein